MATPGLGKEPEDHGTPRPLSGGRHSIDPEVVAHNQRERLLGALVTTVAEHGYNSTTVAQIADDASVSLRSFYEQFVDKEACFRAAYEALDGYIATLLVAALAGEGGWAEQAAAAFAALIGFLAEHPNFARIYLVESFVVGDGLAAARDTATDRLIDILNEGRAARSPGDELPEGIEEGLVGGTFTLLARRVLGGEASELVRFTPSVIEFTLAPYLGLQQARELGSHYA